MADISPAIAAMTSMTNDVKSRSDSADTGGSQFMGVITSMVNTNADYTIKTNVGAPSSDNSAIAKAMTKLHTRAPQDSAQTTTAASGTESVKLTAKPAIAQDVVKEKIKAKIKEIADQDQTPLNDDRPIKALKDVATFLLQAQSDGKITLPDAITKKLQDFLAQADTLKAGSVVNAMSDLIDTFKSLKIALPPISAPSGDDADTLQWPQNIIAEMKDLKLGGYAAEGQKVDIMAALKAVKALVNTSEKEAIDTLKDKNAADLATQDPALALVPVLPTAEKLPAQAAPTKAQDDQAAAQTIAAASVDNDPAPLLAQSAAPAPKAADAQAADPKAADTTLTAKTLAVLPDLQDLSQAKSTIADLAADPKKKLANALASLTPKAAAKPVDATQIKQADDGKASLGKKAEIALPETPKAAFAKTDAPIADLSTASAGTDNKEAAPITLQNINAAIPNIPDQAVTNTAALNNQRFTNTLNAVNQSIATAHGSAVEQVAVQLQSGLNKSSQISVQLTPADLGQVDIRLEVKRDGQAHAVISADRPETLALLQKDASQLEKALQQAGINANAENMSFNLREQRQANQGFSRSKRLLGDAKDDGTVKDLALNVHNNGQIISDTRVNYHA